MSPVDADYETIIVAPRTDGVTVTIDRLESENSMNRTFLRELNGVLDRAEADPACRLLVIAGPKGVFCTGMDFGEVVADADAAGTDGDDGTDHPMYRDLFKRRSLTPTVIVSLVDGRASAGGIGLVAASDYVVATPRSQFSLSEGLWGLLPAMVAPYLIRRIGFQNAYRMTLTTLPVTDMLLLSGSVVSEISIRAETNGDFEFLVQSEPKDSQKSTPKDPTSTDREPLRAVQVRL